MERHFYKCKGEITIICKNSEVFGHFTINSKVYEIHSFGKDKNILIEFNNEILSAYTCGYKDTLSIPSEKKISDSSTKSITSSYSNIRVLVLYTDAANNAVSNITNTATLAVSQMNDAILNSGIGSNLRIVLAGVERLDFYENQLDVEGDVEALSINPNAQNQRDLYQAHLVVLLTDGNYLVYWYGQWYDVYGIVDDIGPDEPDAYCIVEADQATPKYVFSHETGHLFGGRHQNDLTGTYEHGYFFQTGIWPFKKDRTTIMYANPGNYILHYSNPNIEYKNKPTGTVSTNDVARKLKTEATIVEAFRSYIPPMSVNISGPTKGDNAGIYTWTSNVSNGTPPYTYLWEYSLDGFNYIGVFDTTASITGPLPMDNDLYLKLTVNAADSQIAVDYHTTINIDAWSGEIQSTNDFVKKDSVEIFTKETSKVDRTTLLVEDNDKINESLVIYPNPFARNSNIKCFFAEDSNIMLEVLDSNGQKVKYIYSGEILKGWFVFPLDCSDLKSGIYYCQLITGSTKLVRKIIIN